ncbi:AraC-like DNA-binding protein [Umezawaea tangerina]|uniref:AraC-like DNA-binding protein n=1 Tax=Umezawaea tangerina TaxID=84725 RepID=A0A2T0SGC4_9PSEU|nr:AraC-like DNA-binding protein [Umezawaea tangerina]
MAGNRKGCVVESTAADGNASAGAFSLDSTVPNAAAHGFAAFRDGWEAEVGAGFPLPAFSPATTADFRVRGRAARVRDVAVTDVHGTTPIRTASVLGGTEDQVRLVVVRRGAWTLGGPHDRTAYTVRAGRFLLRHVGRPSHFQTEPGTTAKILVLPTATLAPLLGDRIVTGLADSAEVRLLVAHTNMVHTTVADLGPAGLRAVRNTLVELAKAVALRRFDDVEPQLAPALTQAAKDLADSRLTDPGLSSEVLARELHTSARTLQRAFAATGESVTSYIRRRRLEEAGLALTAPTGPLSVSEVAAHWQFSDSSHFTRVFKKHYGRTPTEYTRATGSHDG